MATRLTPFSKILITLLILAGIFFLGRFLLNNTEAGQNIKKQAEEQQAESNNSSNTSSSSGTSGNTSTSGKRKDNDVLKVQVFTWGGYALSLIHI